MIRKFAQMQLWPTRIGFYDLGPMGPDQNAAVIRAALDKVHLDAPMAHELRVHGFEKSDSTEVQLLVQCMAAAIKDHTGVPVSELGLRAVVLRHGKHICTHTETHESDLMVAYWPNGNNADRGLPPSIEPNRIDAPTFVVEDPSRHLTALRLPDEERHSICIKPRPGLLVVGPAHLPHNLHPYMGIEPFIHIVAQVRLAWPTDYEERW